MPPASLSVRLCTVSHNQGRIDNEQERKYDCALALSSMTTHGSPNVLLLRTPAEGGLDGFEGAFNAHGYLPISVAVLQTVTVNVGDLSRKIAAGPQNQSLSGVIVTSKRGLEAWSNAVKSIVSDDPSLVPAGDSGEFEQGDC